MTRSPVSFNSLPVPANYRVVRLAFQQYAAYSPDNRLLAVCTLQRYAVNRCLRDQANLNY